MSKPIGAVLVCAVPLVLCTRLGAGEPNPRLTNTYERVVCLDGREFLNVRLLHQTGTNLSLIHSRGIATVSLQQLPDGVRVDLGLPTYAEAASMKAERERQAAATEAERKRKEAHNLVEAVRIQADLSRAAAIEAERQRVQRQALAETITAKVLQVLPEGLLLVEIRFPEDFPHEAGYVPQGRRVRQKGGGICIETDGPIFVYTDPARYADGDQLRQRVYFCGYFNYEAVLGQPKKVRAYATDPAKALK
jgi:hypothetical protein